MLSPSVELRPAHRRPGGAAREDQGRRYDLAERVAERRPIVSDPARPSSLAGRSGSMGRSRGKEQPMAKGILERLKDGVVLGDGGDIVGLERRGYGVPGAFTPPGAPT